MILQCWVNGAFRNRSLPTGQAMRAVTAVIIAAFTTMTLVTAVPPSGWFIIHSGRRG